MASFYMETVLSANAAIKKECHVPVVWGGIYPTLFPEVCMEHADWVVRGEGEEAFIELADMLDGDKRDFSQINNLVYRDESGTLAQNTLRPLLSDLDAFGWPVLGKNNKYIIENDTLVNKDPALDQPVYDISCGRGCPFACSYCSSASLKKIHKGKAVRLRDPIKIIEELIQAKAKMKKLKYIRFCDEVFPDKDEWLDIFIPQYIKHINLPFECWFHPLRVDENVVRRLRKAGLYKVSMGMQSGSPYIRREIFNRPETNEQIIQASQVLANVKMPLVFYDLMVRHSFETHETMRETLNLCLELKGSFELQMHALGYLPGTAIVQKALDMGLVSQNEMDAHMNAPMKEQYAQFYRNEKSDETMNYLYKLTYLSQLSGYRKIVRSLAEPSAAENHALVNRLYKRGQRKVRIRHIYKQLKLLFKGFIKSL
jgi:radical SAM superfamily enzyme YgiQ (UPF0313 family)